MRIRQPKIVISFHTTADAIRFEKLAAQDGINGKLIPAPREITADCGLAWSSPVVEKESLLTMIRTNCLEVEGIHELSL